MQILKTENDLKTLKEYPANGKKQKTQVGGDQKHINIMTEKSFEEHPLRIFVLRSSVFIYSFLE